MPVDVRKKLRSAPRFRRPLCKLFACAGLCAEELCSKRLHTSLFGYAGRCAEKLCFSETPPYFSSGYAADLHLNRRRRSRRRILEKTIGKAELFRTSTGIAEEFDRIE